MRILPSLLKKRVIKKQSRFIYQYSNTPDPLDLNAKLTAAHRKKPMLSNTMDITIVERIVIDAPLTVSKIVSTSLKGTIPSNKMQAAAIDVGMDSLMPNGLHMIKKTVRAKIVTIKHSVILLISIRHTFNGFLHKMMVKKSRIDRLNVWLDLRMKIYNRLLFDSLSRFLR